MPEGGSCRSRQQRRRADRQRRPTDAELRAVGGRDDCGICGQPLRNGEVTTVGYVGSRLVVVGDCCGSRIEVAWGIGCYFTAPAAWRENDRRWFEANPTRSHRLRPAFDGETVLGSPATSCIAVRQLEPGRRQRLGFEPTEPVPDIEEIAHALFDALAEALMAGRDRVPLSEVIASVEARGLGSRA
jgi:hypothetical protein